MRTCAEHRYWHYVDVPFSPDGTALPATRGAECGHAHRGFPQGARPPTLHAVSRFTQELPEGDLGGNRSACTPCRLTLHYSWDAALRIADTRVQRGVDWSATRGAPQHGIGRRRIFNFTARNPFADALRLTALMISQGANDAHVFSFCAP